MKKFGYVLSGGGARGFAHLGLLKLLEELQIKPAAIAGTSAGAIVGVLYAAGKGPEEILALMKNNSYFGWGNILWNRSGFFSMSMLQKLLKETVVKDDFDALKIPLFIAATDLNKGESIIFSKGKLFQPVIASASVPVVFEPVLMDDKMLVDGGLLNNFPVEPLESICDVIIGSYVNRMEDGIAKTSVFRSFNIIERCFHLAIANSVYSKVNKCDVFIEAPLHAFDMFDVKQADNIFEIGYKTALQHKSELERFLDGPPIENLPIQFF